MTTPQFQKARRHLARRDPVLGGIIRSVGPCTIVPMEDRFHALVGSIISQQISTKAADSIRGKLVACLGRAGITPRALLRIDEDAMRAAGLSRGKVKSIRHLAQCVADRVVRLDRIDEMDDEAVVEHLTPVHGIGRWTAEMFLIFALGRLDVLPVADLGFRNGVRLAYGLSELPGKEELEELGRKWQPYRSIATWYMWQSLK